MSFPSGRSYAKNMKAVGYCDLDGKSAFKMAVHKHGDRWFLFTATLWEPGLNILDVTDPANPWLVKHIPLDVPPQTQTNQIQIADGIMITSIEALDVQFGGKPGPWEFEGFLIWSLDDPENPKRIGHFSTGGRGTHRNYYDGGRYVYVTGLPEGYDGHILQIVDISDPTKPVEISRWWRDGQWVAGGEGGAKEGSFLHGGAYVRGDRAYMPYSAGGFVILDISDKTEPKLVSDLGFSPPFHAFIAVHTALPLEGRPLVIVNSEPVEEQGGGAMGHAGVVDIADETKPRLISLFPLPKPPANAPYKNFYEKGGRFGPHNQHQWQFQDVLLHDENITFLTYFNAGLRVYDMTDERDPQEIAYFIPPDPVERRGFLPRSDLVCQVEDVIVDARRNIYISDKNHGIYVLQLDESVAPSPSH
jgi:hypothetical protein